MSFMDALATIGQIGLGGENARELFTRNANRDAMEAIALEAAKRKAEEERYNAETMAQLRRAAADYGLGGAKQIPAAPAVTIPGKPIEMQGDGPSGGEAQVVPGTDRVVPAAPAQPDDRGLLAEQERIARARLAPGNIADSLSKARKAMEAEGYSDFLKGIVAGEDPELVKRKFNAKGAHKITSITKDDAGNYSISFEDGQNQTINRASAQHLGTALGVFKKDNPVILQRGAMAIDQATGNVLASNADARIDPNSPEAQASRADREMAVARFKAMLAAGKAGPVTAKQRDAQWLADNVYGGDIEQAAQVAFNINKGGKTEEDRTRLWVNVVRQDPRYMAASNDEVLKRAKEIRASFDNDQPDATPAPAPAAAPAPAPAAPPAAPPAAAPAKAADWNPQVQVDTAQKDQRSYTAPNGKSYSWADVVTTARKRGLKTSEVIAAGKLQ